MFNDVGDADNKETLANQGLTKEGEKEGLEKRSGGFLLKVPPLYAVDITAFWLFLLIFLLFNCIYWYQYCRV